MRVPPTLLMGAASLFTLVDLFAPQAIAPTLASNLHQTPNSTGVAVNAAVVGMAASALFFACCADRFDRKKVIILSLVGLSLPTMLIAYTHGIVAFVGLRVAQGFLMAASFVVSIAYIAEQWGQMGVAPSVMAAYVTGNIAGQIVGRVGMGLLTEYLDWHQAFLVLAVVNLAGGVLLWFALPNGHQPPEREVESWLQPMIGHLRDVRLRGCFAVGFLILVCFIGTFTYASFDLTVRFGLSPSMVGLAYGVFVFSLLSTPLAGVAIRLYTHRKALAIGAAFTATGIYLTTSTNLLIVLTGLSFAASGLFFCQAVATAFTGFAAVRFKGAAGGLYLAAYYSGGLVGAASIGMVYAHWGWIGSVWVMTVLAMGMAATALCSWEGAPVSHRSARIPLHSSAGVVAENAIGGALSSAQAGMGVPRTRGDAPAPVR
jgi:MFS transporter, YNFM family, putative membrane transport protein